MRYEVRVDQIARECLWKANGCVVCVDSLTTDRSFLHRIEVWLDRYVQLCAQAGDEEEGFCRWVDWDEEGRDIARAIAVLLGPTAELIYFSEASETYERVW